MAKKGISLRNMLSAFGALALLIGWTMYHANFVIGRSLMFAFPGWEATYRSAWPRPFGGVVARDVTLQAPDQSGTFHFERVELGVPFFEYYRSGFSRRSGALLKSIRNLHFEFSGGHGDMMHPLTSGMALFGNRTAAPFEAEGCANDSAWAENELEQMGLKAQGVALVLDYHSEPDRFVKQQSLEAPGIGRVDFRREMIKHDDFPLFSLQESTRNELASDEWHIKDDGFVAARNRYCAGKDKVNAGEFVQRHVRSVERLLASVGLTADTALEASYRDYARAGGSIDVVVHYDPPIGGELYDAEDLSRWLPHLRGEFGVNGKNRPLALSATALRPLPEGDNTPTTWELIAREQAAAGAVDAAAAPPVITVTATAVPTPTGAVVATTLASALQSATVPAPAMPAPAPAATVARPAPAPTASAMSAPTVAPAAARALASATVANGAAAPPASSPASVALTSGITDYRQLGAQLGRQFTVYQRGREPMRLEILRVAENGDIQVRRRVLGGKVEYVLDRKSFDHAEE